MADEYTNRPKRIHFSPGPKHDIVCGVFKRGGRRVRYTKSREDITCEHCIKCLEAKEQKMSGEGPPVIDEATLGEAKKQAAKFYRKQFELLFRALGANKAKCKGCDRPIWWVTHKNGKRAPYTVDGLNHFADCPASDMFRGKS